MISGIAIGLSVDGGHIGFLPIEELSQGWQSLGTLNMSFTCLNLSYGTKIAFLPICSRSSHSTDRHLCGDSGDDRSKLECNGLVFCCRTALKMNTFTATVVLLLLYCFLVISGK